MIYELFRYIVHLLALSHKNSDFITEENGLTALIESSVGI